MPYDLNETSIKNMISDMGMPMPPVPDISSLPQAPQWYASGIYSQHRMAPLPATVYQPPLSIPSGGEFPPAPPSNIPEESRILRMTQSHNEWEQALAKDFYDVHGRYPDPSEWQYMSNLANRARRGGIGDPLLFLTPDMYKEFQSYQESLPQAQEANAQLQALQQWYDIANMITGRAVTHSAANPNWEPSGWQVGLENIRAQLGQTPESGALQRLQRREV